MGLLQIFTQWVHKAVCRSPFVTRSSAIAGRPCDAKACQGLLKWTWKWQPRLKWPLNVLQGHQKWHQSKGSVYDFLLVVYNKFCRITHRFWEIRCQTVQWPWNMPKVIQSYHLKAVVWPCMQNVRKTVNEWSENRHFQLPHSHLTPHL